MVLVIKPQWNIHLKMQRFLAEQFKPEHEYWILPQTLYKYLQFSFDLKMEPHS